MALFQPKILLANGEGGTLNGLAHTVWAQCVVRCLRRIPQETKNSGDDAGT
jgi:hypothetical protein